MASFALARVYQQSLESHPYGTLAVTNGTLNAIGDVVAQITQNLVSSSEEYCLNASLKCTFNDRFSRRTSIVIP